MCVCVFFGVAACLLRVSRGVPNGRWVCLLGESDQKNDTPTSHVESPQFEAGGGGLIRFPADPAGSGPEVAGSPGARMASSHEGPLPGDASLSGLGIVFFLFPLFISECKKAPQTDLQKGKASGRP